MQRDIMKCVFGSHLYGLDTPQSDTDYKGIFIPSASSILAQDAPRNITHSTGTDMTKNGADDVDTEMFSLHQFIKLACNGETVAIDMLHCPDEMLVGRTDWNVWQYIRENRSAFYTTNMVAYVGYVRKQAAKYGVKGSRMAALLDIISNVQCAVVDYCTEKGGMEWKDVRLHEIVERLPTTDDFGIIETTDKKGENVKFYRVMEKKFQYSLRVSELIDILKTIYSKYGTRAQMAMENEGIDWKAVSHAIRAGEQIKEIYETGDLVYPLKKRDFILDVKQGKLDFTTVVKPYLEQLVNDVEELADNHRKAGTLPATVDPEQWIELIELEYGNHVQTYMKEKYRSY
ncbi:MAG: DNA polymerase beta superfamily protein [Aeromonas veronii]